jgi:ABC-type transporter Mla subunit MlaD
MTNNIKLARATGLIEGTQGALKHVLVYVSDMTEKEADETLKQTNKVLDEVKQLLKEISEDI